MEVGAGLVARWTWWAWRGGFSHPIQTVTDTFRALEKMRSKVHQVHLKGGKTLE